MSFSCNPSLSSSQYHFIDIAFLLQNICNQSCISIETVTASSVPGPCTKQTLEARSKSLLNGKPKGKVGQNHALLTEVYIPASNPTSACIRSKRRVFKGSWPWREHVETSLRHPMLCENMSKISCHQTAFNKEGKSIARRDYPRQAESNST